MIIIIIIIIILLSLVSCYIYYNTLKHSYEQLLPNPKRLNYNNKSIELYGLEKILSNLSSFPIIHIGDPVSKSLSDWVISDTMPTGNKIINSSDIPYIIPNLLYGLGHIPKIIHFIWIDNSCEFEDVMIPDKYKKYFQSWEKHNRCFDIRFWSGKSILNLIKTYLPQYLYFYVNLTPTISKCDFARFVVVYVYGGLYTDLDFICRKNISKLLQYDSYFLFEPIEHRYMGTKIYNGFFASVPNHPFVFGWLNRMSKNVNKNVFMKTGPKALYNYYETFEGTVFFGNTCDALSIIDTNKTSLECSGSYDIYAGTLWNDGSGWSVVKNKAQVTIAEIVNPINNGKMYFEKSAFVTNNYPGITYEIKEKRAIYNMALNLKKGYGIIDVGAHIGDLSIPLAKALTDIGREDIIVYAIDPTVHKCDFIEKMAIVNSLSNISVINCGLSNKYSEFSPNKNKDNNTGATVWKESENKNSVKFYPLDTLYKEGKIGPIGLYHIDVEGHEADVILGSKKVISMFQPIILMEIWIGHGKKCKSAEQCPTITQIMNSLNPPYHCSGFLPNGDMIFTPIHE